MMRSCRAGRQVQMRTPFDRDLVVPVGRFARHLHIRKLYKNRSLRAGTGREDARPERKATEDGSCSSPSSVARHLFQANATLSRTRVPKRSEERATALPPSAR